MKIKLWITLGLICFVLAACNPGDNTPTPVPDSAYIWIDAPLDGSSIPLEPYKIVMHGLITDQHQYEISINGIVDGFAPPLLNYPGNSNWITYGEYLWTPPAPGTYTITVKITGPNVIANQTPAQAQVTVPNPNVVEEGQLIPLIPTGTPTLLKPFPIPDTPTSKPKACTLTALVNLFCRPAPGYEPIDEFRAGQSAAVVAQSEFLYQVNGLNSGRLCTVPKEPTLVSVEGDCGTVPGFTPLLPPTPTDIPTLEPVQGCTVRQAGGAIICVAPCPAGAAPGEACTP